jgi:hypothetical protein
MKINRIGCSRIVIELTTVVIKIPNFLVTWERFLCGMIANIREGKTWKINYKSCYKDGCYKLLCPVLFTSWGGWFLIMKKVDHVLTYDEYERMPEHALKEHLRLFAGDDHGENYGYLNGVLVKIDYGQLNLNFDERKKSKMQEATLL